ncbi:ribonuclease domain-containing protein [Chryseobacterium indoltheticum]|uniref:Ribonuclease n=1 Tax=Chryseobacterium indoltheticum TaxID=254 RepID=A0A381F4S7_9FLAO|nr:ribonuclease domain-containing protein [Chryseobacterium indoltheticum]AZA75093.1 ribonuclease N [Chryseobacterium indoltheticum]SIQ55869.1 ribonuclease [Chryseobacterium indoltheticum]SUX41561.1 Ribonuclease precursor [Chryseobacterium indoltheticum]
MNPKIRSLFFACLGLLFGMSVMFVYNNFIAEKKVPTKTENISEASVNQSDKQSIDELTNENTVINYVKQNHQLPDYYITKNEAKKLGWNPSQGNLCEVLPGKAIGGDYFGNREGKLPKGAKYFEADVNYSCGSRKSDRIVFTKNGEVYLTKDHYKSFEKK